MFVTAALALLKDAETRLLCADIGSAGGFHPRIRAIRERADVIGFDADPAECERLNRDASAGERHINAAIGADGETVTVVLHRKRTTSSLYPTDMKRLRHYPDAERLHPEGSVTFTTKSLDTVCREEKIERLDYIKADIEGHELAALKGYTGPLLMAEVEVSFHPFRQGIPLVDEVMSYMRSQGFLLIDLRRTFWHPAAAERLRGLSTKGFLFNGDALFLRDPFASETLALLGDPAARARYLALLCIYGYAAEALMAIDHFEAEGVMPADEAKRSAATIERECSRRTRVAVKGVMRTLRHAERWFKLPLNVRSGLFIWRYVQAERDVGNWE